MRLIGKLTVAASAFLLLAGGSLHAQALLGPSHYLCFDSSKTTATGDCAGQDSPFKDVNFSWFYFKDYEDKVLDSPGVTMTTAPCPNVGIGCPLISSDWFSPEFTDSVDEDDGAIDGLGQTVGDRGQSVWGRTFLKFTFDPAVLGQFPTHAGVVWTDGSPGLTTFEAWDQNGNSLGTIVAYLDDGSNLGTTIDDHFFGATNPGGVSAIQLTNDAGGIEIDHLQYGVAAGSPIPVNIVVEATGSGCVNLNRSYVQVTILGQPGLMIGDILKDSLQFNGLTVRTLGGGMPWCTLADANLDRVVDLQCRFDLSAGTWNGDNTTGTLTGSLVGGQTIEGTTSICTAR